jgi:1-phosphofructokinase family hexose kinase
MIIGDFMITTITLNPSLDRISYIKNARVTSPIDSPGGKGINVYKVLDSLGVDVKTISLLGGETGEKISKLLQQYSGPKIVIPIEDDNRIYKLTVDKDKKIERILRNDVPRIKSNEMNRALDVIKKEIDDSEIIIISGSLPEVENLSYCPYQEIIKYCKDNEKFLILDTSGEPLKRNISLGPDLIKPNLEEFKELTDISSDDVEDIIKESLKLLELGVKRILISLGAEGLLYIENKKVFLGKIQEISIENTIGAGDSLVAGYVYSLINKFSLEKSLMFAMAMAASNCQNPGIGVIDKDYRKFFDKITIKRLL